MRDDLALIEYRHAMSAARAWGVAYLLTMTGMLIGVIMCNRYFHDILYVEAISWLLFALIHLGTGIFSVLRRQEAIARVYNITRLYINAERAPPWT